MVLLHLWQSILLEGPIKSCFNQSDHLHLWLIRTRRKRKSEALNRNSWTSKWCRITRSLSRFKNNQYSNRQLAKSSLIRKKLRNRSLPNPLLAKSTSINCLWDKTSSYKKPESSLSRTLWSISQLITHRIFRQYHLKENRSLKCRVCLFYQIKKRKSLWEELMALSKF